MFSLISCLTIYIIKKRVFCINLGREDRERREGRGCPLDFGKRDVTSSTGEMLSMFPSRGNVVKCFTAYNTLTVLTK